MTKESFSILFWGCIQKCRVLSNEKFSQYSTWILEYKIIAFCCFLCFLFNHTLYEGHNSKYGPSSLRFQLYWGVFFRVWFQNFSILFLLDLYFNLIFRTSTQKYFTFLAFSTSTSFEAPIMQLFISLLYQLAFLGL